MGAAPADRVTKSEKTRVLQSGRIEIVVVYNEPETLRHAFLESRGLSAAELVLIDNCSPSRGLPELFNHHKATSTAEWIVFCHQDFVVREEGWLDRIRQLSPDACYGPIGVDRRGRLLGRIVQTDGSPLGEPADLPEVIALDEMCIIVPQPVLAAVDFDEQFKFDFYVHDYCQAALQAGFRCRIIQLDCQHRSKSVGGNTTSPRYLKARAAFLSKHGHHRPRGLFNVSEKHSDPLRSDPTLRTILERVPPSLRILQLGVGTGMLIYGLRQKQCVVDAIEPDSSRLSYAAPYGNSSQVGDPEEASSFSFVIKRYQMVLIEHLLERSANPLRILQNAVNVLDPTGMLVVVLRNGGHPAVLLERGRSRFCGSVKSGQQLMPSLDVERTIELLRRAGLTPYDIVRIATPLLDPELIGDPASIPFTTLREASREAEPSTYDFIFVAGRESRHSPPVPLDKRPGQRRELARQLGLLAWHALRAEPHPSRRVARALAARSFWVAPSQRALAYFLLSWFPCALITTILSRRSR